MWSKALSVGLQALGE